MKRKILTGGLICICVIGSVLIYTASRYQNTSTSRLPDKYDANIEQIHSTIDKDQDGIDDQTDILEGTFDYIDSKPKYKSRYYQTGYSDDEYGVCTDVVANALKSAGYDIMVLMQEDIKKNTHDYDIDEPDINIDFRRVKNLKVYFSHTAISLTTDISNIKEWQGGDIVIFQNHIGIVSDRRNKNGVPYVIHHNDSWQMAYEQDILETRHDIAGHYRITE
ncbi:MAG: DUF1287 domain-containing protein [Muricomes sp.]